jgi:hypothetical protein
VEQPEVPEEHHHGQEGAPEEHLHEEAPAMPTRR